MLTWLRSLAKAFLGRTGKLGRLDTATRMAMDVDFSGRGRTAVAKADPQEPPVDPLAELVRIINEQEPKPEPPRPKAPMFQRRRRGR
jgi:hypothetical protein